MNAGITESEILEALAWAARGDAPEDARTVHELCDSTGRSRQVVCRSLSRFKAEGRLTVHRVERETIDGRRFVAPAYTIAAKAKPVAKRKR